MTTILTITGSDNSGYSGLQLDHKTISEMGGHALTSATCIVMQNRNQIEEIFDLPTTLIECQVRNVMEDFFPKAVKVGWLRNAETVKRVRDEVIRCQKIVVSPGILSSSGEPLVNDETIAAIRRWLIPEATLLMLRCNEAERLLGTKIATCEELLEAAWKLKELGAEAVMLRGLRQQEETQGGIRLTAVLLDAEGQAKYFSSHNIEGWQQHGVGGALSAAITTRLGMGDDVKTAIGKAHEYVHSRIVYSVETGSDRMRPSELYDAFMNLLATHSHQQHDVQFYADNLIIGTRYLNQITNQTVGKGPKTIIAEYLVNEAKLLLDNTSLSVKEISDKLGFQTVTRFCTFFRHYTGKTPSNIRVSKTQ